MLNSKQRSRLRAYGNDLTPILTIGKGGINENVVEQLEQALTARELVKSRVLPHTGQDPREIAATLAEQTQAEVVQVIGHNILFFRLPENHRSQFSDLLY